MSGDATVGNRVLRRSRTWTTIAVSLATTQRKPVAKALSGWTDQADDLRRPVLRYQPRHHQVDQFPGGSSDRPERQQRHLAGRPARDGRPRRIPLNCDFCLVPPRGRPRQDDAVRMDAALAATQASPRNTCRRPTLGPPSSSSPCLSLRNRPRSRPTLCDPATIAPKGAAGHATRPGRHGQGRRGAEAAGCWDHTLLLIAIQTGLRAAELIGLRCQDAELGAGPHVRVHGKGRKERVVALTAQSARPDHLAQGAAGSPADPVFPSRRGAMLSHDALGRLVNKDAPSHPAVLAARPDGGPKGLPMFTRCPLTEGGTRLSACGTHQRLLRSHSPPTPQGCSHPPGRLLGQAAPSFTAPCGRRSIGMRNWFNRRSSPRTSTKLRPSNSIRR